MEENTMEIQRGQNSEWENSASFIFGDSSDRNLPGQERREGNKYNFPSNHVLGLLNLSSILHEKGTHLNEQ